MIQARRARPQLLVEALKSGLKRQKFLGQVLGPQARLSSLRANQNLAHLQEQRLSRLYVQLFQRNCDSRSSCHRP